MISRKRILKLRMLLITLCIKIESGATYNPQVEILKQIADALGVDNLLKK